VAQAHLHSSPIFGHTELPPSRPLPPPHRVPAPPSIKKKLSRCTTTPLFHLVKQCLTISPPFPLPVPKLTELISIAASNPTPPVASPRYYKMEPTPRASTAKTHVALSFAPPLSIRAATGHHHLLLLLFDVQPCPPRRLPLSSTVRTSKPCSFFSLTCGEVPYPQRHTT
jgi:hypothetical protein